MTRGKQERLDNKELVLEDSFSTFSLIAAAHELKAPLALIRQLSLAIERGTGDSQDVTRMAEQIGLTSERALRLTTDLTRSARLQDALFELEPINPVALCEDIAHELTPLFAAHGKRIVMRPYRRSLLLVANRDLLRRVIMNFSDNALHYADPDGKVELSAKQLGRDRVRICVRDYGPALAKDTWTTLQEHLHSPQPVHARPQSSGLGLYLADMFADAMNGHIGAIRHRDGASFYVDMYASTQLSLL